MHKDFIICPTLQLTNEDTEVLRLSNQPVTLMVKSQIPVRGLVIDQGEGV